MKLIKSKVLLDGAEEKENMIIGDEIKYVGSRKPDEGRGTEMILEGDDIVVTPAFIDSHSHIGMVRSGEPGKEDESNEQIRFILW